MGREIANLINLLSYRETLRNPRTITTSFLELVQKRPDYYQLPTTLRRKITYELNAREGKHKTDSPKAIQAKKLNWILFQTEGMLTSIAVARQSISSLGLTGTTNKEEEADMLKFYLEMTEGYLKKANGAIKAINNLKKAEGQRK